MKIALKSFSLFTRKLFFKTQLHLLNYYYYTINFKKANNDKVLDCFNNKKLGNFISQLLFIVFYLVIFFRSSYFFKRSTSRAMTNSSSVGITKTRTLAASVEISPVAPKTFFSGSTSQPNQEMPSITI